MKRIQFESRSYLVPLGVFNPERHLSGMLVAEYLSANANDWRNKTVLELGTGCGLLAGVLHDCGASVTATDVSRLATEAAAGNLAGTTVQVRHGDLFEPIAGQRFDIVICNPPYEIGWAPRPRYRSPDFLERLAAQWSDHADRLVLAFPVDSADLLSSSGFHVDEVAQIDTAGRTLGIFRGEKVESR